MKKLILSALLLSLVVSLDAGAATKKKKTALTKKPLLTKVGSGKKLSTDVVFDGSTVNGRYHSAGEAVATVETEKKMNELVGFRRDFRDRLVEEKQRLDSNRDSNKGI